MLLKSYSNQTHNKIMAWIYIDKESGGSDMRSQMRRNMRSYPQMMHKHASMGEGGYQEGYRQGYKHGWEDKEDEEMDSVEFRRMRDSRGRFM